MFSTPVRESIREGEGLLRESGGADYLLFALLEAVVENYVPIIERISSRWRNSKCRYSHGGGRRRSKEDTQPQAADALHAPHDISPPAGGLQEA